MPVLQSIILPVHIYCQLGWTVWKLALSYCLDCRSSSVSQVTTSYIINLLGTSPFNLLLGILIPSIYLMELFTYQYCLWCTSSVHRGLRPLWQHQVGYLCPGWYHLFFLPLLWLLSAFRCSPPTLRIGASSKWCCLSFYQVAETSSLLLGSHSGFQVLLYLLKVLQCIPIQLSQS